MFNSRQIATLAAVLATSTALAQPTYRTLALTGQQAPGLPAGITFAFLSDPRLMADGSAAFWADLAGTGVAAANESTIWSDRAGTLSLILREGDNAGLDPATVWASFPRLSISPDGRIALSTSLLNSAQPNHPINIALMAEDESLALHKIAREGEQAPPPFLPGSNWQSLTSASWSDSGELVFTSNNGFASWYAQPGQTPQPAAISGTPAFGASNLLMGFLDQPVPRVGPGSVFRSTLVTTPSTHAQPVAHTLLAFTGVRLIPLIPNNVSSAIRRSTIVETSLVPATYPGGGVGYWARSIGPGIGAFNDEAVIAGIPPDLNFRIQEESQAVGCPVGVVYADIGRHLQFAADGTTVIAARLAGEGVTEANNSGLWLSPAEGPPTLLAREGDQAPRLPQGVLFAGFSTVSLSADGRVAFLARLTGPAVSRTSNLALYYTDCAGELYPLARTGDLFDLGSESRLIHDILFDSAQPGSGDSQMLFTAHGHSIAFKLVFRDTTLPPGQALSSGLFAATLGCLADFDASGKINESDFKTFLAAYRTGNLRAADLNGDGRLTSEDIAAFQKQLAR